MPGPYTIGGVSVERRRDRGAPSLEQRIDPRTGTLTVRYAPTWVGVREYQQDDGSISRELHRPAQVCAPGWRALLARLPVPLGHPEDPETGRPVWLHVDPQAPGPAGYQVREPRDFAVGWTGEVVEDRPCADYPDLLVPTVTVTFTDQRAIALLRAGVQESSLGYDVFVDRTPGVWVAPDGTEHPYDAEHVLDPADPRLDALAPEVRRTLGPNHLAYLAFGRGAAQSAVRWDAAPRRRAGVRLDGGIPAPPMEALPEDDGQIPPKDHPALLAPKHRYENPAASGGWWGWSEGGGGIAFWPMTDGPVLLWTKRDPSGGVVGEPLAYRDAAPARPSMIAGVTSRTRITVPAEIRRDGIAQIEIPDDPAAVTSIEAFLGSLAASVASLKSELAAAQGSAAEAAQAMGAMEAEMADLRPLADRGRQLDRDVTTAQVAALGLTPRGDTGPAIREAAVLDRLPRVLDRHPVGTPARQIAVDSAFAVLVASAPAQNAAPGKERALSPADPEPAPRSDSQTTSPAARRFREEA